jgi:cell division transport system permease protein
MERTPASQATTTFTTLVGMTLTLVLVGLLSVVALLGARWEKQLRQEVRIQVYFQRDIDASLLKSAILSVETDKAVEEGEYLDPKSESEKLEAELGEDFVEFLGYVPLPPAMDVRVKPEFGHTEELELLEARLNEVPGVSDVVWQSGLLGKIEATIDKLMIPLAGLVLVCLVIALALMNNTVRLTVFSRRFLIRNMQLVGAKPSFIRKPFINQGLVLGITSGLLAFALLMGGLAGLKTYAFESAILLSNDLIAIMAGTLIVLGGLLGIISTTLAVNRYLHLDIGRLH